ncbi:hypothetical protein DFH09DRAFT_145401 [Mycena vulgaris]|nr:hypothetical protein DFH09DRAFT_145401 [Mycena vulgaris]
MLSLDQKRAVLDLTLPSPSPPPPVPPPPMSVIQWLLAALRRLLDNTLVRASIRGLLFLLSALSRAAKKRPDGGSQNIRIIYPRAPEHDGRDLPPSALPDTRDIISASAVPSILHPSLLSAPRASTSSQDSITQEYPLTSLSVPPPCHLDIRVGGATGPVNTLPQLSASPNLGVEGYLPLTNTSVVDFHSGPTTEAPNPSRRSSEIVGDVALASIPLLLSEEHKRIFPGTPDSVGIGRYSRKVVVPDEPTRYTIPPLTISLLPDAPPLGWTVFQHLEGAIYFFNEEKRVFTDANLFDKTSLVFINTNISTIHDFLRVHNVQLAPDVDLVLDEYTYDDQTKGCQYYFVNHKDRSVFWMDKAESDMFSISQEVKGIKSKSHIRHELEGQYWYHCELFPKSLIVTREIVDELRGIVQHALTDVITSDTSTVSWKVDKLQHMLKIIDGFCKNENFSGASCLVGRLMCLFVRERVYNFHGVPGARLSIDQSVYGTVPKRTMLITLLSPLLFYAPNFHLVSLQKMYVDGLVRHRGWSEFITRLNNEWQEFTLYATVVLNANVAFLSIQSVDQGGLALPDRTHTQISSYLSMLTSIGAIIIGLLLSKQNRDRDRETAPDAAKFISNWAHPTLGLETLAVLYSLPYAMLIWSMVSFLAAFSFMCFDNSSLITRTLVAILWAAVAALILCCIFTAWESGDWDWLRGFLRMGHAADAAEEEANSPTKSEPQRRRAWLSFTLRNRSFSSSERTVTNV